MVKTLPEVEQAIAQYQIHIGQLQKVISSGSTSGKAAASAKLAEVRKNLDLLLKQRDRLAKEAGLSGLGYFSASCPQFEQPQNLKGDKQIIKLLQNLLLTEYLQRDVYETYSYYLFGLCSPELQQHLEQHRQEEDKHIKLLNRYLMSLRAEPLLDRLPVPAIKPPIGNLLLFNLNLEKDAVADYAAAIIQLEKMQNPQYVPLRVDIENILVEEQEHVHDLEQWLRKNINSAESQAASRSC